MEFPCGPVVRAPGCQCRGTGSTHSWGNKNPCAMQCGLKQKGWKRKSYNEYVEKTSHTWENTFVAQDGKYSYLEHIKDIINE